MEELRQRVGGKRKLMKLIRELEFHLPEVFRCERGSGRKRNSYFVAPYNEFPVAVIERLEASKSPQKRVKTGKIDPSKRVLLSKVTVVPQEPVVGSHESCYMALSNGSTVYGTTESSLTGDRLLKAIAAQDARCKPVALCANQQCKKPLRGRRLVPSANGPCCSQECAAFENNYPETTNASVDDE